MPRIISIPHTTQSCTRVGHVHCQFHALAKLEFYTVRHTTVAFTIHCTSAWNKPHTIELGTCKRVKGTMFARGHAASFRPRTESCNTVQPSLYITRLKVYDTRGILHTVT